MASDLRERAGARPPAPRPAPRRAGRRRSLLWVAGVLLLAAGLALAALLAWDLWGTGLATQRAQAELRRQLDAEVAHPAPSTGGGSAPQVTFVPTPARGQPIAEIRIPRIDLDMVVVEGTSSAELATGPGHYVGTAYPWEGRGRVGIAGHRTTYLHPFWALDRLRRGDRISLKTPYGTFVYAVTGSRTVLPQDVWVLKDTGEPSLVLTTCTPRFSASHRLVVFARRVDPSSPTVSAGASKVEPPPVGGDPGAESVPVLAGDRAAPGGGGHAAVIGVAGGLLVVAGWVLRRRRRRGRPGGSDAGPVAPAS